MHGRRRTVSCQGLALKVSDLNLFTLTIILLNFVFLTSANETLRFV